MISTINQLARELLDKPDDFINASLGGEEYVISSIRRIAIHANNDDTVTHWTLNLREGGKGNLKI